MTHELRPNGGSIGVTDETKLAYVHAVADFHLKPAQARRQRRVRHGTIADHPARVASTVRR